MEQLGKHLLEMDKAAREQEEIILKQLEKKEPLPDKEKNQMAWVRAANQHKLIIHLRLLKIINDTASLNNSDIIIPQMRLTSKLHHASFVSCAPINCAINIPATVLTAPITTEKISEKLPHNPTADIFVSPNCPIMIWISSGIRMFFPFLSLVSPIYRFLLAQRLCETLRCVLYPCR